MPEEHDYEKIAGLEDTLSTLHPRASRLDRDQVMFLAGRASSEVTRYANRQVAWPWQLAAVAASVLAIAFASILFLDRAESEQAIKTKSDVENRQTHARPPMRQRGRSTSSTSWPGSAPPIKDQVDGYLSLRNSLLANESETWPNYDMTNRSYVPSDSTWRAGSRIQIQQLLEG